MHVSTERRLPFAQVFLLLLLPLFLLNCKNQKALRRASFNEIQTLKNNALLVRLHTAEHIIDALEKRNLHKEAEATLERVEKGNARTIEAFKNQYTFSKVYFFHSGESNKLKNKNFDEVVLVDADGNPVQDLSFLKAGYLVATFGMVYHDQLIYTDSSDVKYPVAGVQGTPGLVVMDRDYVQLNKPFPFKITFPFSADFKEGAVSVLNKRLNRYYRVFERKRHKYGI